MWNPMKTIHSLVYRQQSNLTSELYFKLNLNNDKSKQIDIQISPNTTLKDVYDNFRTQIESNAIKIDPDIQEYKFILKDKLNKYNEFVLKKNILLYNYMQEEKYELYYLPFHKKKSYSISIALKDKNSLQHKEKKENTDYTPLDDQLIKKDNAFKYSKKLNKFVPVIIFLHRDMIEVEKVKSGKFPIEIPLSSISDIKEIKDIKYKDGFSTMMISSMYNSKLKKYVFCFNSRTFDNWFLLIFNQIHQFLDTFTFLKICDDLTDLNRKKTSFIIQLANKFSNIKGVLSLNFSKNIFYEFYDNKQVKELYDSLVRLRDDILDKKKLTEEKELINKIISIVETNEEFNLKQDNKNLLDILKQNLDKINEKNNINENKIDNINEINEINIKNEDIKFLNDSIIYTSIDNLITNYFEPSFNNIMDSKSKIDFMNKILNFIIKIQNNEDNKFFDFNSDIKELIIA